MVRPTMRWEVLTCFLLIGCSADTYGLGDDVVPGIDATASDTSAGDDTEPLFETDDDTGVTTDAAPDTAPDTAMSVVESGVALDSTADAAPEAMPDVEVETSVDSGVDSGVDAAEASAPDTAPVDTGVVASTFMPSKGAVVCADGSGGTKLCAAGQICCGTSSGYSCKSSCSAFDKDYACDETADCSGSQICCTKVSLTGSPEGSDCRESWLCFGPRLCQTDAECGSGKTCAPYKPSGAPYTMGRCP